MICRILLAALLVALLALPAAAQIKTEGGFLYLGFRDDKGTLDDEQRWGGRVTYEMPLDDSAYPDNYLEVGVPVSTGSDWAASFALNYSRRLGESNAFFKLGGDLGFLGENILGKSAIYWGPRAGFWLGIPVSATEILPLTILGGVSWHASGLEETDVKPTLLFFSCNVSTELLQTVE